MAGSPQSSPYPILMKYCVLIACVLGLSVFAKADEASHKAAAMKLLGKINSKETMMASFSAMLEPMSKQMAQQGIPQAGIDEVRAAVTDWLKKEVDFDVIAPKLADLYVKEFTEDELNQIVKFYDTDLGKKLLAKLPVLMQQGAVISQQALESKKKDLQNKVVEILSKYAPAGPGGAPGGAPGGSK